jgi:mRNA-degrading endonuclease toxin of MazEF toxin-antitoxin module
VTAACGAVLRVELNPARGSERKKARPCVVVQRDAANAPSPTLIVCPSPTRVAGPETCSTSPSAAGSAG